MNVPEKEKSPYPELRLGFLAAAAAAAAAATAAEPQPQVFHEKCHFQNLSKKNHKVKKNWKKNK